MKDTVRELWSRWRDVFRRRRLEAELAEEMRLHLEWRAAAERAAGASPEEARRAARRQFGAEERLKEECRDEWSFAWFESLRQDLGCARRALAKSPGFVLGVCGTLAVAIGAAAALLGVGWQVLRPTLPFADPATLLVVQPYDTRANAPGLMSAAQFHQLATRATAFRQLAAQHPESMNLVVDGRPAAVNVACITPEFFGIFGVLPELGRTFAADEHRAGGGAVAVLAHSAWMTRFGGDPEVLGRAVLLGGVQRRIIGVMPESFRSPVGFPAWDVFLPSTAAALAQGEWWRTLVWVVGRLSPGESVKRAQAEFAAIPPPPGLPPEVTAGIVARIRPVRELYRSERDRIIAVLIGAGGFLYAMACASAFNLVLMRTTGRRAELRLRAALGGPHGRIGQLLVVENLLLIGAAGAAAGMLAAWFSSLFVRSLHYWWPSAGPLTVPGGTLTALVGAAVLGAVVTVGLAPVVCALRGMSLEKADGRRGGVIDRRSLGGWRSASTAVQAALAVVLLVGAALCGRALLDLMKSGVGFDPVRRVAVVGQRPPPAFTYPPPTDDYFLLAGRLQGELARLPGVERGTLASRDPLSDRREIAMVRREGSRPDAEAVPCGLDHVSAEYFATLDLPLLRGRGFDGMKRGDPGVMVISETMARRFFPGENPLGRRLDVGTRGSWRMVPDAEAAGRETWEVIGVVRDVRDAGSHGALAPQCYVPFWQRNPYDVRSLTVILRWQGAPPAGFAAAVREAAFAVDPDLVIADIAPLEERADLAIHLERCASATLGAVSAFALIVAGIGVFSVLGGVVAEQRRELGVRLALGAPPGDVEWLVLRRGLGWTALGIALGLGAAWALARLLAAVLHGASAHDPAIFGTAGLFVFVVAGFACWLPARRAAGIDPMMALRVG